MSEQAIARILRDTADEIEEQLEEQQEEEPEPNRTDKIEVRVTPEMKEDVRVAAAQSGRSMSEWMRDAVRGCLNVGVDQE